MAQAYARTFSVAELGQVLAFEQTPAGQAWQRRSAEVDRLAAESNRTWLLSIQRDAHKRFCAQTACPAEDSASANPAPAK